jgi:hypothetical protein
MDSKLNAFFSFKKMFFSSGFFSVFFSRRSRGFTQRFFNHFSFPQTRPNPCTEASGGARGLSESDLADHAEISNYY